MIEQVIIHPLDRLRSSLMRRCARTNVSKAIFGHREKRHILILSIGIAFNILFMIFLPLWTLMIVPSILGMLHLIESLDTFFGISAPPEMQKDLQKKRSVNRALASFCLAFFLLRGALYASSLLGLTSLASILSANLRAFDMLLAMSAFLYISAIYRLAAPKRILGLLIFIAISYCLIRQGIILWGIFILSHNFMAFYYWHQLAPSKKEKRYSMAALLLFLLSHGLFLSDMIFSITVDQSYTSLFGYTFATIAADLFPGNFDLDWSRRIVSLLCFGQGVHYAIWIYIIPDCRLGKNAPMAFKTRFKELKENWGGPMASILVILCIVFLLLGVCRRWDALNDWFFALAFFHIYAELIALGLRALTKDHLPILNMAR